MSTLLRGVAIGALGGVAGAAAMAAASTREQLTRRPDSHVPAHALDRLLGRPIRMPTARPATSRCATQPGRRSGRCGG